MANFIGEETKTKLQVWMPVILMTGIAIAFIVWVWRLKSA